MTTLLCPAKVNLYLAILGRDPSGYHQIDTVFARLPQLADVLEIEPAAYLQIEFLHVEGIEPENNTISKAIHLLEQKTGRHFSYKIHIHKNIPLKSGLGGAASDAASLLLYLNEHEHLNFSREKLMRLGAQIGMDVPFFLSGFQVARGTHFGEIITPLPDLPKNICFEIHLGPHPQPTQKAYTDWDSSAKPSLPLPPRQGGGLKSAADPTKLLQALAQKDSQAILKNLSNDFQRLTPSPGLLAGSGSAYAKVTLS